MGKRKKVDRAGIIPYHIEDGKINMIFMIPSNPKYGTGYPQIGKGHIEKGETALEAAIREGTEELGLFGPNMDGEPSLLGKFLGRTTIYIVKIKDKDLFGDPHFETKEVKWMTPAEFDKNGRQLHKPIVRAAKRWIITHEKL